MNLLKALGKNGGQVNALCPEKYSAGKQALLFLNPQPQSDRLNQAPNIHV